MPRAEPLVRTGKYLFEMSKGLAMWRIGRGPTIGVFEDRTFAMFRAVTKVMRR
jgi:hypothetical protein